MDNKQIELFDSINSIKTNETTKGNKHVKLLGSNYNINRAKLDLYETPSYFTEFLLQKEKFNQDILEPCCGNGRISQVLLNYGYNVKSSDIQKRNFECEEIDFLQSDFEKNKYDIVTNPPYSLSLEIIKKATFIAKNKIAIVGRVQFLEGKRRYQCLYKDGFNGFRLSKCYFSVKRVGFDRENISYNNTSTTMSAWFIFTKEYNGFPIVDWINY
jgi:hypothetical protein